MPEKVRESVWDKVSTTLLNPKVKPARETKNVEEAPIVQSKLTPQALETYKKILEEKGSHKDWT